MTIRLFSRVIATLLIVSIALPHSALAAQSDVVNAVNQIRLSDPNVPVGTPNPRGLVGNIIDNMFYPVGPKQGKIRPEYLDVSLNWSLTDLSSAGGSGYIPKYTGTGITLGNSAIFESGGNVGIGTTTPSYKLDVVGTINASALRLPNGSGSGKILTSDGVGNASWQTSASGTNIVLSGWENVPLTDTTDFDINCQYRVRFNNPGDTYLQNLFAGTNYWGEVNTLTPKFSSIAVVFGSPQYSYGFASNNKSVYVNRSSDTGVIGATGYNIVEMRKNCGWAVVSGSILDTGWSLSAGNTVQTNTGSIGIGTTTPSYKLDVVGTINASALRLPNGSGAGKILTSDASGNTSWQDGGTGGDTPIGTVAAFNLAVCPTGWSPANGTSGTPDLRGEFIRGLDSGRGVDTGRVRGSWQADEFKSHNHSAYNGVWYQAWLVAAGWSYGAWWETPSTQQTSSVGGSETRPRNVALLYCIKTSAPTISSNTTWTLSGSNVLSANTGNVGIGTTSPGSKLHISGAGPSFQLEDTGQALNFKRVYIATSEVTAGDLIFGTRNDDNSIKSRNVTIQNNGNVGIGIGTSAPSTKLEVKGNIRNSALSSGYIELSGDLPGYPVSVYPTLKADFPYLYFSVGGNYSAYMSAGWILTAVSDKNKKENFKDLNFSRVLSQIDELPIVEWNYKTEDSSIRHISPMAQDFARIFGLNGPDDKMISHIDPSGVALAGIKGLIAWIRDIWSDVKELEAENIALKARIETLEKKMDTLIAR